MSKAKAKVIGGIGEKKSNKGTQWYQQDRIYEGNVAISIATSCNPYYNLSEHGEKSMNDEEIRKLTPKEVSRLMGLKDEDTDRMGEHQTNAERYKLSGNSICTTCLMAIFGEMLGIDWKEKFNPKEWWKNE